MPHGPRNDLEKRSTACKTPQQDSSQPISFTIPPADSEYGSQSSAESRRNQGIHLHFRLTRDQTRPTIQPSRANLQLRHPLHCRCFLIPHLLFEPRQMPAWT